MKATVEETLDNSTRDLRNSLKSAFESFLKWKTALLVEGNVKGNMFYNEL